MPIGLQQAQLSLGDADFTPVSEGQQMWMWG